MLDHLDPTMPAVSLLIAPFPTQRYASEAPRVCVRLGFLTELHEAEPTADRVPAAGDLQTADQQERARKAALQATALQLPTRAAHFTPPSLGVWCGGESCGAAGEQTGFRYEPVDGLTPLAVGWLPALKDPPCERLTRIPEDAPVHKPRRGGTGVLYPDAGQTPKPHADIPHPGVDPKAATRLLPVVEDVPSHDTTEIAEPTITPPISRTIQAIMDDWHQETGSSPVEDIPPTGVMVYDNELGVRFVPFEDLPDDIGAQSESDTDALYDSDYQPTDVGIPAPDEAYASDEFDAPTTEDPFSITAYEQEVDEFLGDDTPVEVTNRELSRIREQLAGFGPSMSRVSSPQSAIPETSSNDETVGVRSPAESPADDDGMEMVVISGDADDDADDFPSTIAISGEDSGDSRTLDDDPSQLLVRIAYDSLSAVDPDEPDDDSQLEPFVSPAIVLEVTPGQALPPNWRTIPSLIELRRFAVAELQQPSHDDFSLAGYYAEGDQLDDRTVHGLLPPPNMDGWDPARADNATVTDMDLPPKTGAPVTENEAPSPPDAAYLIARDSAPTTIDEPSTPERTLPESAVFRLPGRPQTSTWLANSPAPLPLTGGKSADESGSDENAEQEAAQEGDEPADTGFADESSLNASFEADLDFLEGDSWPDSRMFTSTDLPASIAAAGEEVGDETILGDALDLPSDAPGNDQPSTEPPSDVNNYVALTADDLSSKVPSRTQIYHEAQVRAANDETSVATPEQFELAVLREEYQRVSGAYRRLQSAVRQAKRYQEQMLPTPPRDVEGLEFGALYKPAEHVSGDFYDFIPLTDGRFGLLIGDSAGHGLAPALIMTAAKKLMQVFMQEEASPADLLRRTNRAIHRDIPMATFITALAGVVDARQNLFTFGRAGHTPAIILNPLTGDEPRILSPGGMALGMDKGDIFDQAIKEETVALKPGDIIVLYTDGVIELANRDRERFGQERFLNLLREFGTGAPAYLMRKIQSTLQRWRAGVPQEDDISLIAVKIAGQ